MTLHTLYVVGAPGSGKTTMMKKLIPKLGVPGRQFETRETPDGRLLNPVIYREFPNVRVALLGLYDASPYGGTDRLGLNVAPVAVQLLQSLADNPHYNGWTVLGEGDRLAVPTFLDAAAKHGDVRLVQLVVSPDELERRRATRTNEADGEWLKRANKKFHGKPRRADRDHGQDPNWLLGRLTKVTNLTRLYPTTPVSHNSEVQTAAVATWIHHQLVGRMTGVQ